MRPTVHDLHHSGRYVLIESFGIDEMNQFVLRELGMTPPSAEKPRMRGLKTWLFILVMLLAGGLVGYVGSPLLISQARQGGGLSIVWQLGAGIFGLFVLLPIHEFIHGLAFKSIGAPHVGYGYSLKSLMVYAYSQLFPATMREVAFVAIMPFLVITLGLVTGMAVWPAYTLFWIVLIIVHISACLGDFALIRYYLKNRDRVIYTYDDVENERRSYFFTPVTA
ncbi:hypothetical protein GCM10027341_04020 [Spirosoma knui]